MSEYKSIYSFEGKTSETYRELLKVYLKPPYTFELPQKRLEIGDPNYDFYICRNSVLNNILTTMFRVVQNEDLPLNESDRSRVRNACDKISNMMWGMKAAEMRTAEEMEAVRSSIEEIVDALKKVKNGP